ncbi:hypothetical protein HRbin17_01055 [bacterium HR17]|jgi:hypothetical protein|uniref:Uncharacterized protein n=1 Tax=Candidatus Fervidibacter japonicus TaxID=2035412 RepID=A0A2H5XBI0_9BACT|nr:hypothetical protein HRbin17_01055 [bacterium HR17]
MTAEQKFTAWLAGAAVCFLLAVVVGVSEGPRWAVGPLIILALLCCVGMINNAVEQPAAKGHANPRPAGQRPAVATNTPQPQRPAGAQTEAEPASEETVSEPASS